LSYAFLLFTQGLKAQLHKPARPEFSHSSEIKMISWEKMPLFNKAEVLRKADSASARYKTLTFAKSFSTDLTPENSGKWVKDNRGNKVWLLGIYSAGAYSLNLIFDRFSLPYGAKLFVYNAAGTYVLGAFTEANSRDAASFPVSPVPGERIIVEYQVPEGSYVPGSIRISQVSHDFRGIIHKLKDGSYGASQDCNIDINCTQGADWQLEKHAVCRIIIKGTELCTGTLINNTAYDGKPYLLTANHCIANSSEAVNSIFYFNYESPYCNGPDGSVAQSISSSTLRATTSKLDFSLVELSRKPPFMFTPYYSGWNLDTTNVLRTVSIHHPQGDVKKIALDFDAPASGSFGNGYDPQSHWKISRWDEGTTEPGSSGAPLFDQNHRVIGDLTGGDANCANSVNDYFSKISRAWDYYADSSNQLKYWLDPLDASNNTSNGYEPYAMATKTCDTISNIAGKKLLLDTLENRSGYITGQNSDSVNRFAEKFILNSDTSRLIGAYLNPGAVSYADKNSLVGVEAWSAGTDGLPAEQLAVRYVPVIDFLENYSQNFVLFDSAISVSDTFFIAYHLYYNQPEDTFAVLHTPAYASIYQNTAYFQSGNTWFPMYTNTYATSLAIMPVVCGSLKSAVSEPEIHNNPEISFYPNPVKDQLTIRFQTPLNKPARLNIISSSGMLMKQKIIPAHSSTVAIEFESFEPGIYFLLLTSDTMVYQRKLLKIE